MQVIGDLAKADKLSIFVGAGASIDQGLPSWSSLVSQLLQLRVATIDAHPLIDYMHQMPAASVVDELYRAEFGRSWKSSRDDDMRNIIYPLDGDGMRRPIASPSLAEYILKLAIAAKIRGADVHVITTNYDDLLERAAVENTEISSLLSAVKLRFTTHSKGPASTAARSIPIVHIHGYLPFVGKSQNLVFSEADYVGWDQVSSFRDYLLPRFATGHVLFVGSSLRDNNIAAIIRRSVSSGGEGKSFALLPVEDDLVAGLPLEAVKLTCLRGSHLGVEILRPDFYGQVYQFLHEVALFSSISNGTLPVDHYKKRIRSWWTDWASRAQSDGERLSPEGMTSELQTLATVAAEEVPEAEHVKAELWLRVRPDQRELELWASSQSVRTDGSHYWPHRVEIRHFSRNAAVKSFAARTAIQGIVDFRADERWTHHLSVPVILSSPPYYELPVGVFTLLFHAPDLKAAERLSSVESKLKALVDLISQMGYDLLSPLG